MIKQKLIFVLILIFLVSATAKAEVFQFKHVPNTRYRLITHVEQRVFFNGVLSHQGNSLSRVAIEVTGVENGTGFHRGTFQTANSFFYVSQFGLRARSQAFQWGSEYESEFARNAFGNLTVGDQYFMPVKRDIPVFPERELNVGDTWTALGYEIHDFSAPIFGIPDPYRIPVNVNYTYLGERQWKGETYPAFSATYNINMRPFAVRGRVIPVHIQGNFEQLIYWDRELGQMKACDESYDLTITMSNGIRIRYTGTAQTELVESTLMDRNALVTEIIRETERLGVTGVNVREADEGVTISLEDIRFHADTDIFLPGEREKLERIAEILRRYPDRDILISGHTALSGTAEERLRLSQDRARAVADYLITRNVRTADRIITRGFGADRPIADNSSEEGRSRNRRVEITILEN